MSFYLGTLKRKELQACNISITGKDRTVQLIQKLPFKE
ncbi:hypothetical protein AM1_B0226 (plasmid) [Acaryochloris marina MBIC11017]|uniref:Uncharacterized protein n=1 Tax=Acaryochloris marina (strain MBIC 11017) TaxID=329726 RepID=A8ZLB9_ACAM1|nr:hypothetical protein AM1_B0226 [Acaryochloris marina MBIC11017]